VAVLSRELSAFQSLIPWFTGYPLRTCGRAPGQERLRG
jgi:hypothetical protein